MKNRKVKVNLLLLLTGWSPASWFYYIIGPSSSVPFTLSRLTPVRAICLKKKIKIPFPTRTSISIFLFRSSITKPMLNPQNRAKEAFILCWIYAIYLAFKIFRKTLSTFILKFDIGQKFKQVIFISWPILPGKCQM